MVGFATCSRRSPVVYLDHDASDPGSLSGLEVGGYRSGSVATLPRKLARCHLSSIEDGWSMHDPRIRTGQVSKPRVALFT